MADHATLVDDRDGAEREADRLIDMVSSVEVSIEHGAWRHGAWSMEQSTLWKEVSLGSAVTSPLTFHCRIA